MTMYQSSHDLQSKHYYQHGREALGQELRQFWIAQIAPHITRTVQDNFQNTRQQLTEMQRQVTQVRQSLSEDSIWQHPRISYP